MGYKINPGGSEDRTFLLAAESGETPTQFPHPVEVAIEDDGSIYLFITVSEDSMTSVSTPPDFAPEELTISLRAGYGDALGSPVLLFHGQHEDRIRWDSSGVTAIATLGYITTTVVSNIYRVTIDLVEVPRVDKWEIIINQNYSGNLQFVWVMADDEAEAGQPWLDIPVTHLNFNDDDNLIFTGQINERRSLDMMNRGTGPVNISRPSDPTPEGFYIADIPDGGGIEIDANTCTEINFAFDAPAAPGQYNMTMAPELDAYPSGVPSPAVTLDAICHNLETVMVLDASGSMGLPVAAGTDLTRWDSLGDSAEIFRNMLNDFSRGMARFSIVLFPDINDDEKKSTESTAWVLQEPARIDEAPAMDLLSLVPSGRTPMGCGMQRAMGPPEASATAGLFQSGEEYLSEYNYRWMVLMSDGAHNLDPPDPADFYDGGVNYFDEENRNVRVFCVAYGEDSRGPHDRLQEIADHSPDPSEFREATAADLLKAFNNAIVSGLCLDCGIDPPGLLTGVHPECLHRVDILPYDTQAAFIVNWTTRNSDRVAVYLLTPNCEWICPYHDDEGSHHRQVRVHRQPNAVIYTVPYDYLRNATHPDHPRHGQWTLVVSGMDFEKTDTEFYSYEVIVQSNLKLKVRFDRTRYWAGDAVHIFARLLLNGKPVTGATVHVRVERPGSSAKNWIAGKVVTAEEFRQAAEQLDGADVTALDIKAHALSLKGETFESHIRPGDIQMTDTNQGGEYTAVYGGTRVPGTYKFHITAVGHTKHGIPFRRERSLHQYIDVRPEPDTSFYHIVYRKKSAEGGEHLVFDFRIWLRDRFDNVVLSPGGINQQMVVTVDGDQRRIFLEDNLDGSYSAQHFCDVGAAPVIHLVVNGQEVVPPSRLIPVFDLHYADHVVAFKPGYTASGDDIPADDPQKVLGDVTTKGADAGLHLGYGGSLMLGVKDKAILAADSNEVVVFIHGADHRCAYQVQALPVGSSQWMTLGASQGVTQAFSLAEAGLRAVQAIRINDTSHPGGMSPPGSGVAILGAGFAKVGPVPEKACGCLFWPLAFFRKLFG